MNGTPRGGKDLGARLSLVAALLLLAPLGCIYGSVGPREAGPPVAAAGGGEGGGDDGDDDECSSPAPGSFDAFVDGARSDGFRDLARRHRGCRIDWEAIVFNVEAIPSREHPDPDRRGGGEMARLLLMSPNNPPGTGYGDLPEDRRTMLAVPERMGTGFDDVQRGDRIGIRAVLWTVAEGAWEIVWVRDYEIRRME